MSYVVRMPQMGMSMEEGHVVEWERAEGDEIEAGADLVVVESEKASNVVEAREDGLLRRILVPEGSTVEPGDPIGIVADQNETLDALLADIELPDAASDGTGEAGKTGDENTVDSPSSERSSDAADGRERTSIGAPAADSADVRATPGARRLADEEDVSLPDVTGTGPQGVITEDDVADHASSSGTDSGDVRATPGARRLADEANVSLSTVTGTGPQGVITEDDVRDRLSDGDEHDGGAPMTVSERHSLSEMQSTISERLQESYQNAVHVTLNRSFDAGTLRSVTDDADRAGVDVSVEDVILKSVAETLAEFPAFNARFEDGEHRLIAEVNLGVAVDVPSGLVTPVVPRARERSVEEIHEIRRRLTDRAQSGDLTMDDLSGGTFTVSNLGVFGVDDFDPIIDPPQVAILGLGRIREDGMMTLSLSFDHRVVNGADAARVLDALVNRLTDGTALSELFDAELPSDGGELGPRAVSVEAESSHSGRYRTAYGDVTYDEPEAAGGTGSAPSPVEGLLGALGSCLSVTAHEMARREDVEIESFECEVTGSPDHGPLEAVDLAVRIVVDADDETVDRILTKAERACYVSRSLSDDLDVNLEWTRV